MASNRKKSTKPLAKTMVLYCIKIHPPSRAVWLYLLQNNIPHNVIDVDLSGNLDDKFLKNNPHRDVPLLIDGSVTVFNGQAILRYLSSQYTKNAGLGPSVAIHCLTESIISWANSELHRLIGFNYVYPQFLDRYRLPSDSANEILIESGLKDFSAVLETIDKKYLKDKPYLTGDKITVADTYVATIIIQLELVSVTFRLWPNIEKWLEKVKTQSHWGTVHEVHAELYKNMVKTTDESDETTT